MPEQQLKLIEAALCALQPTPVQPATCNFAGTTLAASDCCACWSGVSGQLEDSEPPPEPVLIVAPTLQFQHLRC